MSPLRASTTPDSWLESASRPRRSHSGGVAAQTRDGVRGYSPRRFAVDALGRRDEAFQELDRAVDENSYTLLFLRVDPKVDNLRQDLRFALVESRVFPKLISS